MELKIPSTGYMPYEFHQLPPPIIFLELTQEGSTQETRNQLRQRPRDALREWLGMIEARCKSDWDEARFHDGMMINDA